MSEIWTFGLENRTKFSSDFRHSDLDIRAVWFVQSFGYTINVRNPNVWLVESINRTSEIRTKLFGFRTVFEIRTVSQPNQILKHRNPNIRISDVTASKIWIFVRISDTCCNLFFDRLVSLQKCEGNGWANNGSWNNGDQRRWNCQRETGKERLIH